MWKHLTSQTAKKCSVSVCWKSSDTNILECRSHPCWVHASGHKWMPTVTHCVDCVKLFAEWDLDISLGCDLATQQAKLRQHMSDTNIAVTSLGTSGPSTLQSWPSCIGLPVVWDTEATHGRMLVQNKEEEEMTIQEWLQIQKPEFYHDWLLKFTRRWNKCINAVRNYTEN